jgi:hypothetical protein
MLRLSFALTAILAFCSFGSLQAQQQKDTKQNKQTKATITHVDAQKGTVTVQMKDKDGKDVKRTFHLTEDAEYIDSTGKVATLDVFQSGDEVLVVEGQGHLKQMKQVHKGQKTDHQDKTSQGTNTKPGGK